MKHAIHGTITFENGVRLNWLRFIEPNFTPEEAKQEAIRLVAAQHKGMGIELVQAIA